MGHSQTSPDLPVLFRGIHLRGNPTRRPAMSACVLENLRLHPGSWIRLRGGRKAKRNTVGGVVQQIRSFKDPNFPGSNSHMAQVKYAGTNVTRWEWFDLATYTFDPFTSGTISQAYDSAWAYSNPAAYTNITDRPVFYNGLGVRDGTNSRPALSSYYAGVTRFFGLDAYCPAGTKPTVAFAAGAGNNTVSESVQIWVGLYHEPTGHFSNGVEAGEITVTGATGTITVSNLQRLISAYNNATEQGELKYVFYASIDGYEVPYLIMNAAHTGPLTAASTATTQSLSVETAGTGTENGWFLDKTTERPTTNFPPKPMKSITVVNGRMYGVPLNGGSGVGADFGYTWTGRNLPSVAWSKANGDDRRAKLVGDPQQSWPLENIKPTPNVETPIHVCPSNSGNSVLVFTSTSLFLMTETSAGVHEFDDISRIHGLVNPQTVKVTDYGISWVDQRNHICLLTEDSKAGLRVISENYQSLLRGKTVQCADYVLDPDNEIDRYQVWCSDGVSLCHDFAIRDQDFPDGTAYTLTGQNFTAAATLVEVGGTRHYVVARTGFYCHEAQPSTGLIPTTDDTFSDTTTQAFTTADISGEQRFNWNHLGDWKERKQIAEVAFIGDGKTSAHLATFPIKMKWWGDFQEVPGNPTPLNPTTSNQTTTDWSYRFAPTQAHRFVFKIGFTIAGHSVDDADFANHRRPDQEGDLDKNFYGSICEAAFLFGNRGNR